MQLEEVTGRPSLGSPHINADLMEQFAQAAQTLSPNSRVGDGPTSTQVTDSCPLPAGASMSSASIEAHRFSAKLLHGTCGWSQQQLSIYPHGTSAEARLPIYSQHFSAVEVDTSTYAVPNAAAVERWVRCTPPEFKFAFKAFGAFCGSVPYASLPATTRALVPTRPSTEHIAAADLPPAALAQLWDDFHRALEPARAAGKLACVVAQYHTSFSPTDANRRAVAELRRRLDVRINLAVEFRNRTWLAATEAPRTCALVESLGCALVASDELVHETAQRDKAQMGLAPGERREVLPTLLRVTAPWGVVVRVHRRHGTVERVLDDAEIRTWAQRLEALSEHGQAELHGPIYFFWHARTHVCARTHVHTHTCGRGTDWADAALTNSKKLTAASAERLRYDWVGAQHEAVRKRPGSIGALFSAAKAEKSPSGADKVRSVAL